MVLFTNATIPNQTAMLVNMEQMRGLVGELSRLVAKIAALQVAWTNGNAALFTALDVGMLIPDVTGVATATNVVRVTGLNGAAPLTREEVITMCGTNLSALVTANNSATAQALYIKMVGALNAVGG